MKKALFILVSLGLVIGCSSNKKQNVKVKKVNISGGLKGEAPAKPVAKKQPTMPPGHGNMAASPHGLMQTDGGNPPLKKFGMGSAKELNDHLKGCVEDDPKAKEAVEKAFRLAFTVDRSKRDLKQATTLFKMVLGKHPHCALAHRAMAYIAVLDGFNVPQAIAEYKAAIKIDPKYGEALYGLATLMLNTDAKEGLKYYKEAMKLGIPDEHGLKDLYSKVQAQ